MGETSHRAVKLFLHACVYATACFLHVCGCLCAYFCFAPSLGERSCFSYGGVHCPAPTPLTLKRNLCETLRYPSAQQKCRAAVVLKMCFAPCSCLRPKGNQYKYVQFVSLHKCSRVSTCVGVFLFIQRVSLSQPPRAKPRKTHVMLLRRVGSERVMSTTSSTPVLVPRRN